MKRSGQVGLVVMGAAAFVATYASVYAYRAQARSSDCTPRQDGRQNCQPAQRSTFAHFFYPGYGHGGSTGSAQPVNLQGAALTNSPRTMPAANTGVVRSGFGTTAGSGSFRVSAGG
jgi:hypothetical protein